MAILSASSLPGNPHVRGDPVDAGVPPSLPALFQQTGGLAGDVLPGAVGGVPEVEKCALGVCVGV